jgi:isochorismate synthase
MFLSQIINPKLPFVIFKKPNSGKLQIWQQLNNEIITDNHLQTPGYYFFPFDAKKHPAVVFPSKQSKIDSFLIRHFEDAFSPDFSMEINTDENAGTIHKNKVNEAIKYIRNGIVNKIIISRTQEVFVRNFNPLAYFLRLAKHYNEAYVYLWHHPSIGTWAGASPEKLGTYQKGIFFTVALAGTLPVKKDEALVWTKKEIKEQQFVTNYIVEQLSGYGTVKQSLPQSVFQGNMAHIKTGISVKIHPEDISKAVHALHPTPAVCGLPVQKAQKLIHKIEKYDRQYYTGFLGEINNQSAGLYVNLRCMQILPDKLILYAGGGIVAGSKPEKEWKETQIKTSVLLSLLK